MKINSIKIRKSLPFAFLAMALALSITFTACDEASSIGPELAGDEVSVIVDSSFTVTANSIENNAVLSRTVIQLLGIIDAPDFGYIKSDFVTQFMPANSFDTAGVTVADIDSLKLVMLTTSGSFVGDSLALMGLEVYPLTKQLSAPIYSNFDPQGYYDSSKLLGTTVYNLAKTSEPDSLQEYAYHSIRVDLPVEMGRKFYSEYLTNPSTYSSPTSFAQFFPGLYVRNSYGSGRITRIGGTTMQLYYHQHTKNDKGNDTTYYKVGSYFAVTPEIITNNDITLEIAPEVNERVADGDAIILAPAGLDVQINFPATSIISAYNNGTSNGIGVVNTLSFTLPVNTIENKYDIGAPDDVLLVLKKELDEFFLNNKLPDKKTSFSASLTTLDNGTKAYVFSDMRQYIVSLMKKDKVEAEDMEFVLVPVTISSETNNDFYGGATTTVTAIIPYVSQPKMAQILPEKAKINFVYSKQTTNF